MSVRIILRFNKKPSHALTTAEPWTRWLVETESPGQEGHVIGKEVALRKMTNALNIITDIEVEQLQRDPAQAQRYLDACDWWLHRAPFGVDRLPVKVVAHRCNGSLVNIAGWRANTWDLRGSTTFKELRVVVALSHELKELAISVTGVADLSPLENAVHLEVLNANWCAGVCDLSPLQACRNLREIRVVGSGIADLNGLQSMTQLEVLHADNCANLFNLAPLSDCRRLRELRVTGTKVGDLSALRDMRNLRVLHADYCDNLYGLSPLQGCHKLRELRVHGTRVSDLNCLGELTELETIDAGDTPLSSQPYFDSCLKLSSLDLRQTNYEEMSRGVRR